ncbi:hypothetical protein AgCh_008687 [Apium graveolens]
MGLIQEFKPPRYKFSGTEDGAITWVNPKGNSIKVTVDVALFAVRREYGLGMVARDSDGFSVAAKMKCYPVVMTAKYAEVLAIKEIKEVLSWIKIKVGRR